VDRVTGKSADWDPKVDSNVFALAVSGPRLYIGGIFDNAGGATDFCARFLDANDKPLKGYTISLTAAQ
jgi:hypothetical protein